MNTILTIIAAIVIFAVLIFVHEFGHFITAKLAKIKVHEFALGMGPRLFGFTKGETKYSVRLLPIGGYCALEGEDSPSDDERALVNKPPYIRLLVLAAGAIMNILLGFVLLNIAIGLSPKITTTEVAYVEEESQADLAGLKAGDKIIKIDSARTPIYSTLGWELSDLDGSEKEFTVKRNGEKLKIAVSPALVDDRYIFGITFVSEENNMLLTIKESFHQTFFYSKIIIETFFDLVRGKLGIDQMSGPIGIVSEIGGAVDSAVQTGRNGIIDLLFLAVLLTVNLGIFNLLPLPALDGGRIFFVLVEMVRRKPLPPEKEGIVHLVGLVLLLLFSVFIAYKDILKFF